eukprot:6046476-Prymnesium_polylepis.1
MVWSWTRLILQVYAGAVLGAAICREGADVGQYPRTFTKHTEYLRIFMRKFAKIREHWLFAPRISNIRGCSRMFAWFRECSRGFDRTSYYLRAVEDVKSAWRGQTYH